MFYNSSYIPPFVHDVYVFNEIWIECYLNTGTVQLKIPLVKSDLPFSNSNPLTLV